MEEVKVDGTEEVDDDQEEDWRDQVQIFRETVVNQPGLKSRTDDKFLLRFLRAKKFDQKKALQMLKNYYNQRRKYPELYKDLRASSMSHVLATPNMGPLASRDPLGRAIYVLNSASLWDPSRVSADDSLRYSLLSFEKIMEDEQVQRRGVVIIVDARGFGLRHLAVLGPRIVAKTLSVSYGSFPVRFKGCHVLHAPAPFRALFAMARPFLTRKIQSRIRLYGSDLQEFHEAFPSEILPLEFGGALGPFDNAEWNKSLLEYDQQMDLNMNFGYLEQDP